MSQTEAQQHRMPQDNWTRGAFGVSGAFGPLAVGPDDNVYVAVGDNSSVAVYDRTGVLVRQFGTNLYAGGIAFDSQTNVYVLRVLGTNHVVKFSPAGELLHTFAEDGTNDQQVIPVGGPSGIAVGNGNKVYLADVGGRRVQVYDQDGNHLFHWGDYAGDTGGILGRFSTMEGIAAMPNGDILVRNGWNCCGSSPIGSFNRAWEVQLFSPSGVPLVIKSIGQAASNEERLSKVLAVSPDGLVGITRSRNAVGGMIDLFTVYPGVSTSWEDLVVILTGGVRPEGNNLQARSMAFDRYGTMYVSFYSAGLYSARRVYAMDHFGTNVLPIPHLLSVTQRPQTSLVDVDYEVIDKDSPFVITAMLVFLNNQNDLSNLRLPRVFAEGTSANLGSGKTANTVHRVTWDASELATNFVNLQFEVLASDGRGLLPLNFVTIPAAGTNSSLTLSRSPVSDGEMLSVWYWLLGTNAASITLTNGVIKALGGVQDGQTLASGTSTTQQGRQFLNALLGVRAPDPSEILRAQAGSYGFQGVDGNSVVKLP